MKRLMVVALLAFGLMAFTPRQNVSDGSQENEREQRPMRANVSPDSLDFGDQVVQTIGKTLSLTFTNNTERPIERIQIDIADGGEDFVVEDDYDLDSCSGTAIAPGKGCRIKVVFFPLMVGERRSNLLVTCDDPDHPQKISLRGNGTNPRG